MLLSLYSNLGCNFSQADSLIMLFSTQHCAVTDSRDRTHGTSGNHTAQGEPDVYHHLPVGYGYLREG
jgi:hypothetical protein